MRLPSPITSRSNARVKALRAVFHGRASRPGELIGIEGLKAILEASTAGLRFESIAVTTERAEELMRGSTAQLAPRELLVLTEEVMASVVDTISPPPIAAVVSIPEENGTGPSTGIFLLLDGIQDPGNMGTLIRTAEAFGVERLYLSPECANPWSPKVMRASAGSVFRQAMRKGALSAAIEELQAKKVRVAGAVARSEGALNALTSDLSPPLGIAIGNEGSGLSQEVLSRVDEKVYIPCLTESLNAAVAGSVLLYGVLSRSLPTFGNHRTGKGRSAA